jgi:glutaredoxin 3
MSNLFKPSLTYKPFHYPWAVEITQRHERVHWVEEEADLSEDVTDWKLGKVAPVEKDFITHILRLFTQSDVQVGAFYYDNLIPRIQNNECRNMLGSFAVREGVHQRAYALLNDTLGLPESEFHAFLAYAEMKEKAEHMSDADVSTDGGLLLALAKGVFNEGVSLFASFAMLLTFQRRGLMKGMGKVVEWSQRDETIHVEGVSALFRNLANEQPELVTPALKLAIYEMARETVRLEDDFIDAAFAFGAIEGLKADEVKQYVRFVADRRLTQLGLKENWQIEKNPLPWVDWLVAGADHTNFFEGKVTEYEVGSLQGEWGYGAPSASAGHYTVYTKMGCPYCVEAKSLLNSKGISFIAVDLSDDAERGDWYLRRGFVGKAGPYGATMPKVYEMVGGQEVLVGGFNELKRHLGVAA